MAVALHLAAIGIVGASVGFGALTWLGARTPPPIDAAPDVAQDTALDAASAYLDELEGLAQEAGFVVENGLKRGIVDITERRYDDDTLREMPTSWGAMLTDVSEQLEAVEPPPALREAHRLFLDALRGYAEVASMLAEAAVLPGDRGAATARAADHGEASDQVWNAGAVIVQDHLRALGADPVAWLPDPEYDGMDRP